ncbi:hypothetical protein B0H19DRAFT_1378922 [Mycena capillaripes]|nr:hypothetical protein B0H19DRAFT_1378922 [Mycena capillaripes]
MCIFQWPGFYGRIPRSQLPLSMSYYSNQSTPKYASIADLFLTQKLNLTTSESFYEYLDLRKNASLHDLENILYTIFVSMFWTVGNTPPLPLRPVYCRELPPSLKNLCRPIWIGVHADIVLRLTKS